MKKLILTILLAAFIMTSCMYSFACAEDESLVQHIFTMLDGHETQPINVREGDNELTDGLADDCANETVIIYGTFTHSIFVFGTDSYGECVAREYFYETAPFGIILDLVAGYDEYTTGWARAGETLFIGAQLPEKNMFGNALQTIATDSEQANSYYGNGTWGVLSSWIMLNECQPVEMGDITNEVDPPSNPNLTQIIISCDDSIVLISGTNGNGLFRVACYIYDCAIPASLYLDIVNNGYAGSVFAREDEEYEMIVIMGGQIVLRTVND